MAGSLALPNRATAQDDYAGGYRIVISIADKQLRLYRVGDEEPVLVSTVITGGPQWPTPIIRRKAINRQETRPRLRIATATAIAAGLPQDAQSPIQGKNGMIFYPPSKSKSGGWEMSNGPANPLGAGAIRFEDEGLDHIFMHGTNEPHRFNGMKLDLSMGCIRVEEILALQARLMPGNFRQNLALVTQRSLDPRYEAVPLPLRANVLVSIMEESFPARAQPNKRPAPVIQTYPPTSQTPSSSYNAPPPRAPAAAPCVKIGGLPLC